jgi:hypothetical protein
VYQSLSGKLSNIAVWATEASLEKVHGGRFGVAFAVGRLIGRGQSTVGS